MALANPDGAGVGGRPLPDLLGIGVAPVEVAEAQRASGVADELVGVGVDADALLS